MQQVCQHQHAAHHHSAQQTGQHNVLLGLGEHLVGIDDHIAHRLAGTGFHLFHQHIGHDVGNGLCDLACALCIGIGDRDLHDLGSVHIGNIHHLIQLGVGHIQIQFVDHLVQHGVALDDDRIGADQVLSRVEVITGEGGGRVLTGIHDHVDRCLVLGCKRKHTHQQADQRCRNSCCHDLHGMRPQQAGQFHQINGLLVLRAPERLSHSCFFVHNSETHLSCFPQCKKCTPGSYRYTFVL